LEHPTRKATAHTTNDATERVFDLMILLFAFFLGLSFERDASRAGKKASSLYAISRKMPRGCIRRG
jgi:hypothetical protein